MPSYLYSCPCGGAQEITHSITEDPDVECSECGGYMFRKPQPAVVTFNSGGFYSTDKNK